MKKAFFMMKQNESKEKNINSLNWSTATAQF